MDHLGGEVLNHLKDTGKPSEPLDELNQEEQFFGDLRFASEIVPLHKKDKL